MSSPSLVVAVRLSSIEAKFLEFVGQRGGEIPWDWSKCRPDVVSMVRGLVDDKRLMSELRAEGRIRLTDQGRSALAQIDYQLRGAQKIVSA